MKKSLLFAVLFVMMVQSVSAITIIATNATYNGTLWNEDVYIVNSTNVLFYNVKFNGTKVILNNNQGINITESWIYAGEFGVPTYLDTVDARYNYWDSTYAPRHQNVETRGCPDGDGASVYGQIVVSPWYRAENLSDASGNCNPTLAAIADQTGNLGILWTYTAVCTDPNALDTPVYTDNTSLFIIGAGTGLMSYTPGGVVDEAIRVTCSDTEFTDTEDFQLTVAAGTGYVEFYGGGDISASFVDNVVSFLANMVEYAPLIVMVMVVALAIFLI